MSRRVIVGLLMAAVASGALALSCGGSGSNGYQTGPGGGGGGGALELNSGNIATGTSYSHTFNTAGTFNYHCTIHAAMTGTITVVSSGGNTPAAAGMNGMTSFSNGTQTINVGSSITWTNGSGITHTVTSF